MNTKHRVKISVANRSGSKQEVMQSSRVRMSRRLLTLLFGEFCEILVLSPGETVQKIEIQEMRDGCDLQGNDRQQDTICVP